MNNSEILQYKLKKIPHSPGCYIWKDKYNQVIYVGKAKDLFKRTHQYFLKDRDPKTTKLVENIYDIDFITVKTENESLILENDLIKKYKPKFNILLKEGSNYPYIVITNEQNPRLIYTRINNIKGKYYGPFATSESNPYRIYKLLNIIFPLRKCRHIPKKKCLYYDLKQCLGPCIKKIDDNQYSKIFDDINAFFKGNNKKIINEILEKEKNASNTFMYEDAKFYNEIFNNIKNLTTIRSIYFSYDNRIDVIGFYINKNYISFVIFAYRNNKLLIKNRQISEINGEVSDAVSNYVFQYYKNNLNLPKKCFVSLENKVLRNLSKVLKINFNNPDKGKYKEALINAMQNAKFQYDSNFLQYLKTKSILDSGYSELKSILKLNNLSLIHVFDVSNLYNDNKVGAMIAIENGEFNKNLYRKFIIKNENLKGDTQYMGEIIEREYTRILKYKEDLPNLIIVDGGKQQTEITKKILKKLCLNLIIPVIGLTKNKFHKTEKIYVEGGGYINIEKKSNLYMYLTKIQDEIHRFAITFFRSKKNNSILKTKLNEIPGLGQKKIEKLLSQWDNISNIKNANIEEISQIIGYKLAKMLKKYFNSN